MQRKVVGALVVALALGIAACGSSSEPLSPAEFRTQANAVCRDVTKQVLAIQRKASEATMQTSLKRAATVLSDGLDQLEGIEPPSSLADRYEQFVAWKGTVRDAAVQLAEPDERLSARAQRAMDPHEDVVGRLAQDLRLSACI